MSYMRQRRFYGREKIAESAGYARPRYIRQGFQEIGQPKEERGRNESCAVLPAVYAAATQNRWSELKAG